MAEVKRYGELSAEELETRKAYVVERIASTPSVLSRLSLIQERLNLEAALQRRYHDARMYRKRW